ncbi:MAG: serine/threonine-protein kinase [Elainellaceae cyanobacterium]
MPQLLLGRYIPTRLLGQGGFGAAFLAIDRYTPTMRRCVVKQFLPSGDLSPDQLQVAQDLFEREAEALEKLGNPHPQIPNLFAFFELGVSPSGPGQPSQFFYLVQEYIDGQNMEEELEKQGAFSLAEVREVLNEVLKVLTFVHQNGSIHRDIKPSNIMRDRQGRIHLLDFGAVKQIAQVQGAASHRSTGIYSMGYAPPEQMAGGVVYPATDLYALGVTCITLLTNKSPMELYDTYTNTWNWRAYIQVDALLEGVLNRMLLAAPSERFQSAEEVLEALQPNSGFGGSTPARQASPPPPVSSPPSPASSPPPVSSPPPPPPKQPVSSSAQQAKPAPVPSSSAQSSVPLAQARAKPTKSAATSPRSSSALSTLSPFPILSGAAFLGFEVALVAIATSSILGASPLSFGIAAVVAMALVALQLRQIIEKVDLVILAGLSLVIALVAEAVFGFVVIPGNAFVLLIVLPVMAGLLCLSGAIVFFLIYRVLTRFL